MLGGLGARFAGQRVGFPMATQLISLRTVHAALVQRHGGQNCAAPGGAPLLLLRPAAGQCRGHMFAAGPLRRGAGTVACSAAVADNSDVGSTDRGLPFALSRPWRPLRFAWGRRLSGVSPSDMQVEVDALVEGEPSVPAGGQRALDALLRRAQADCAAVVPLVLAAKKARRPRWPLPALASVSLVLCDDPYIQSLNAAHRGKDAPTDVLSFEVPDEPGEVPPPIKLLGDLVVSLDTAARQAEERGYSLEDELRVLLVHGCLHLVGFDHEQGGAQLEDMAKAEADIMATLGWKGQGLIEAATAAAAEEEIDDEDSGDKKVGGRQGGSNSSGSGPNGPADESSSYSSSSSGSDSGSSGLSERAASGAHASTASWSADSIITRAGSFRSTRVGLVALDMDGTLLDSSSRILPSSAKAIRAALAGGTRVVLATGKARPAALAACRLVGLEGDGLLVSTSSPGVFLQGLAVHGIGGKQLSDAALPPAVVADAFAWATAAGVSAVAFLGDECATLKLTDDLVELHTRYYEPLARETQDIDTLLAGPPVRKLLFMADEARISGDVAPHWGSLLSSGDGGAEVMQAVPNMLEVVPRGVNKWAGLQVLLDHLGMSPDDLMAVGDGGNDAEMVRNAGLGVAMGNAVKETLAVASVVVAGNDDGGIEEAFERFVL